MIERPTDRYGRQQVPRRTRRSTVIALTLTVLVVTTIGAFVAFQRFSKSDVDGELGAYQVLDDRTVQIRIGVTRADPSRPVVCIVRAKAADGGETGRREILVPPSTSGTVQVTTTVKTVKPSSVGDVYGCGTSVPSYLVAPSG